MFGLRSARGRAILAGALLVLVLAAVASVVFLRARQHQHRLLTLESTAASVAALEHARAQFFLETTAISTLIFTQDPILSERYQAAAAGLRQDLDQARAEMVTSGEVDHLATLERVIERIDALESVIDGAMPVLLAGDQDTILALANTTYLQLWPSIDGATSDLEALANGQQSELATATIEANRAADVTSWIVVGFAGAILFAATGIVAGVIASVVQPLAALRASARAITSGDLEVRAKVSGPEEVASLARDFNEMTDALSAKTQEYIDTTNLTGDIIVKIDKHGRWTFLNDAACQFFGGSRDELLGTDSGASLHPGDLEATAQAIREVRADRNLTKRFVNRFLTPMGTRVVEWNGHALYDENGQYAGVQGTGRDITDRRRAEEALQESEQRYRSLVETSPDAITLTDLNTNIIMANDQAVKLHGYESAKEVIGRNALELIAPEDRQRAIENSRRTLQTGTVRNVEYTFLRKDGSSFPAELSASLIVDAQGRPKAFTAVTRDVSQHKRAQEALQESEERYRNLFDSTHDMIQSVAPDGRLLFVNRVWLETLGYTEAELPGLSLSEIIHPQSLSHCRELFSRVMAGEPTDHVEATFVAKDGRPIAVEGHASVRRVGGRLIATHGFFRDVTERKRAEEEREKLHAELELRAITDSLTGLYDHAHFYKRLAEEIERSKRYKHGFALLMMDVDDFKRFNDSRGHKVGDEMLRLVADCIRAGLRRSDLAFRYGGDEFAAILPHADTAKARVAVDRINRRITRRLKQMDGDAAARLTLTAGVACFPDDGTTADELVRIADATLYNAKWVARARDIMGQKEDIQSLVSALVSRQGGAEDSANGAIFHPEALHEQQARIVSSVASSIAVALKDAGVAQALEDPDLQVLATVGAAAEIKDRYIRGHPERMSERVVALAEEMGLAPERVRDIRIAALLHDIGKVTVSEGILNKPGKLTRREFASVKDHPIVGATLVSQVRGFEQLAKIVRHHHERFDGTGYPDGLAGEDIPPESRILSVLDVFDALTHQRSYRNAMSREEAIAAIERGAGSQFDPVVVKAFLALMEREGGGTGAPAEAASEDRQLAAARSAERRKG